VTENFVHIEDVPRRSDGDTSRAGIQTVPITDSAITDVRTVAELERWFPLADLERDGLSLAA
jgi:hypothetical protein